MSHSKEIHIEEAVKAFLLQSVCLHPIQGSGLADRDAILPGASRDSAASRVPCWVANLHPTSLLWSLGIVSQETVPREARGGGVVLWRLRRWRGYTIKKVPSWPLHPSPPRPCLDTWCWRPWGPDSVPHPRAPGAPSHPEDEKLTQHSSVLPFEISSPFYNKSNRDFRGTLPHMKKSQ